MISEIPPFTTPTSKSALFHVEKSANQHIALTNEVKIDYARSQQETQNKVWGEMAQSVQGLQAQGPKFGTQNPRKKPGILVCTYNPSTEEMEAEGSLGLADQPAWQKQQAPSLGRDCVSKNKLESW